MRVEIGMDFKLNQRQRKPGKSTAEGRQQSGNSNRQLRWLALALHIEDLVLSGQVASYAEIAGACGVSRARVTKVLHQLWDEM